MVKKPLAPLVLLALSMALAACDTTPPAVSVLMQQVAQACRAQDTNALRGCYAKEGVTAEQIDQQVGGWDAYLDKGEHWTYSGITYVSMADAPNNKSLLPEGISLLLPPDIRDVGQTGHRDHEKNQKIVAKESLPVSSNRDAQGEYSPLE